MSDINSKLAAMATGVKNPIAFTSSAGAASTAAMQTTVQANIQLLIDAVSKEGTDATDHRLYLDEMSPIARTSLYVMLTDLKAKSIA